MEMNVEHERIMLSKMPGRRIGSFWLTFVALVAASSTAIAQSVCLPAPRLLTTMPMGGTVGTQVEVTITGDNLDDADEMVFTDPRIKATRKLDAAGQPEANKYVIAIAADCPTGLYEARVMTRLGMSSSRIFSVGSLPEMTRTKPNTSLATAMELKVNSLCNAVMSPRAADFYMFDALKGQRLILDCASRGIDSKLEAVLVIGDEKGRDLVVERRTGLLDFTVPKDGKYSIKVHELTYGGGPAFYYRLALHELPAGAPIVRHPSTKKVSSFSWPPQGLRELAETAEVEPNNNRQQAQKISIPCDIAGTFAPAADVDMFEFEARKGDVWWVEVASERLGLPTDPAVLVQHVSGSGDAEKLTDVAEFSDIPSPMRVSSNGYSYDGPPYDAGSPDILGKLEIKEDGIHRLQITDLYGGTRNDPRNVYRLIIRKAAPDFAVVAWGLHMELRNGDRNALSKPIALRGGSTIALEVVTIRRDGFNGDIELAMEGLPEGVTARGLKIPAGQSRGIMLITAHQDAPRGITSAKFIGRAEIGGATVTRPCHLASMAWPIAEAWNEIPSPRLLADVPVSVSGFEFAPITVAPAGTNTFEVAAGEKLTIPLALVRRSEFSGGAMQMKTFGTGFESVPQFDVSLATDASQVVVDLGALKTAPGEYVVSFYGSAVAKYKDRPAAVVTAEREKRRLVDELKTQDAELKRLAKLSAEAQGAQEQEIQKIFQDVTEKLKTTVAAFDANEAQLKKACEEAKTTDLVDIVVSEPVTIRVKPTEKK